MKAPHPIPYQGSKRHIAQYILPFFPRDIATLIEPFAGSAAISIAAACSGKASHFHLNDLNRPLMALWNEIINDPQGISESYRRLWTEQQGNSVAFKQRSKGRPQGSERAYYDLVRDKFNQTHRPDYLLYLLARCVKASVRYNPKGEFNQSPDNRRLGRTPQKMADDIFAVSNLFINRTIVTSQDYREVLENATTRDLVYMDPPYQGVCSGRDSRYYSGIEADDFIQALRQLDQRHISFILSYDGRTGSKSFGRELPEDLGAARVEVEAGRSSQATLLGGNAVTVESLYLSRALLERLNIAPHTLADQVLGRRAVQLELAV
jgi:DNA adenine methylase